MLTPHAVVISAPGYASYKQEIVIAPASLATIEPPISASALSVLAEPGPASPPPVEPGQRAGGCGCHVGTNSASRFGGLEVIALALTMLAFVVWRRHALARR